MKNFFALIFIFFISACINLSQSRFVWIQNDQDESIHIKVDGLNNAGYDKMVIIQHGLASNMEHVAVQSAKKAFLDNGFVVVTFDGRYSLGKGNNDVEKVKLATFEEDLQSVINWVQTQPFYSEPFALVGHSLGGASIIQFGADHPDLTDILIPITPVISGQLWEKSCMINMADFCKKWKQNGSYEYTDPKNQKKGLIPYSVIASCNNYNADKLAEKIKTKTLLIGAQNDIVINPSDIQALSKKIKNSKAVIIKSANHNFSSEQNQSDLYQAIDAFLK